MVIFGFDGKIGVYSVEREMYVRSAILWRLKKLRLDEGSLMRYLWWRVCVYGLWDAWGCM